MGASELNGYRDADGVKVANADRAKLGSDGKVIKSGKVTKWSKSAVGETINIFDNLIGGEPSSQAFNGTDKSTDKSRQKDYNTDTTNGTNGNKQQKVHNDPLISDTQSITKNAENSKLNPVEQVKTNINALENAKTQVSSMKPQEATKYSVYFVPIVCMSRRSIR